LELGHQRRRDHSGDFEEALTLKTEIRNSTAELRSRLRLSTLLLVIGVVALALVRIAPVSSATVQQCNAPSGSECTLTFNLNSGDKVSGSVSITGGSSNDINFYVTNPSGARIYDAGRVSGGTSFSFTADSSGAFILHFDNSFSLLSNKQVTVSYDVSSGGIPEFPPEIILVAFVALVITGSYVMVRRRNYQKSKGPPSSVTYK
jgi:emp24/gp25L/p24 family/GOLD